MSRARARRAPAPADHGEALTIRARLCGRVTAVAGSFEAIPVRDGTFTQIWSVEALHHAEDRRRALGELFACCAPACTLALHEVVRRSESVIAAWAVPGVMGPRPSTRDPRRQRFRHASDPRTSRVSERTRRRSHARPRRSSWSCSPNARRARPTPGDPGRERLPGRRDRARSRLSTGAILRAPPERLSVNAARHDQRARRTSSVRALRRRTSRQHRRTSRA